MCSTPVRRALKAEARPDIASRSKDGQVLPARTADTFGLIRKQLDALYGCSLSAQAIAHRLVQSGLKAVSVAAVVFSSFHWAAAAKPSVKWWQTAVIYQIYIRSFQDTNGDGIGDLNGVRQRLDYLKWLGVDAIWLNPFYPSPLIDTGYDVTDFTAVDPEYGTLADLDLLIREARQRHIRVLMDFVPDHTSDQHPWFLESARSRTNAKADWYIWADGKGQSYPNNWKSFDSHTVSAWEFEPRRGQYYYHMFDKRQPSLNWRNPSVRQAMIQAMEFWLCRGVAGFRLDAVNYMYVDAQLRDNPPPTLADPDQTGHGKYTFDQPEYHQAMRQIRRVIDRYPGDRVLLGETSVQRRDQLLSMYGKHHDELSLAMNFNLFWSGFSAADYRRELLAWEAQEAGWPLLFFSNHDFPRSHTRLGDGVHDAAIDRVIAALLLTGRGTPIIYYGEELGMADGDLKEIEKRREQTGRLRQPPLDSREAMRTPMQWDSSLNAGFSVATPWVPVERDAGNVNVAGEMVETGSLLNLYRRLLQLRRTYAALNGGDYVSLAAYSATGEEDPAVLCYLRRGIEGDKDIAVVLNLSAASHTVKISEEDRSVKPAVRSILLDDSSGLRGDGSIDLSAYGIFIAEVAGATNAPLRVLK